MPSSSTERRDKLLLRFSVALFVVSTAFPVLAGLSPAEPVLWVGLLDVTSALILVVVLGVVDGLARSRIDAAVKQTAYRAYRMLMHLPLVLLVIFFIAGDRIKWNVLLPGLAWRVWLLGYALPAILALWKATPRSDQRN